MSTYAAYYNLASSRRGSANTNASSNTSKQSKMSVKAVLEQLRPTEETLTPMGIYTPIINRGPLFSGLRPAEKAQEPTPIYDSLLRRPLFSKAKKGNEKTIASRKHSAQQAAVDAALLR